MDLYDQIITGEAVVIEARPAGVMTRVLATLIDIAFYVSLAGLLWAVFIRLLITANMAQGMTVAIVTLVGVVVVLPTSFEVTTRGRSPGKYVMGTRVVRDDGGPVAFRHTLIRSLVGFIEIYLTAGILAFYTSVSNPRSKRVGDFLAGTYVTRVRGTEQRDFPILCPPELESWAAAADMRMLPSSTTLWARTFLARTHTLTAAARTSMGQNLAAEVERFVAPRPPAGTHPERFLAAVVATRRDREYAIGVDRKARNADAEHRMGALPHGVLDAY